MKLTPNEDEKEGDGENWCKNGKPPHRVCEKDKRQGGQQSLKSKANRREERERTIDGLVLCLFFMTVFIKIFI